MIDPPPPSSPAPAGPPLVTVTSKPRGPRHVIRVLLPTCPRCGSAKLRAYWSDKEAGVRHVKCQTPGCETKICLIFEALPS